MKFGCIIIYVKNVKETVDFYTKAFGCTVEFIHESGEYAQLSTGEVAFGFAGDAFMRMENGIDFVSNSRAHPAAGFEIAFSDGDVTEAFNKAVAAGAIPVQEPVAKFWGQTIAHVRDNNGILVEICSPMSH